MDVQAAIAFVDQLLYTHTGKYLSDLERAVFIGSWQGHTYEKIYPENPEYVEKHVGYRLWRKLSEACGEKVTKKQFRGALERVAARSGFSTSSPPTIQRVFISYRQQEPDATLAKELCKAITTAGHEAFLPQLQRLRFEPDWLAQMETNLQQCSVFLLLLSPQAAVSEMVVEELQHTQRLRAHFTASVVSDRAPVPLLLLPVRVNCPASVSLNHDLRNLLQDIPQWEWRSPTDTPDLIQALTLSLNQYCPWSEQAVPIATPAIVPSSALPPKPVPTSLPSPTADPELPQGQVRLDSDFYIERVPQEPLCYREILQPGTLIRIKAPRQMGKTSLMSRILYQAREHHYYTVPLSFQHADVSTFKSLDSVLQWFCSRVARKLRLPHPIQNYWTDTYGSKDNCTLYFEDCLLSEIDAPLVLGLDEVDRIFQYPTIADDFFGLLRAWYEEAGYGSSDSSLWEKLRLVVVHSTEVYIPLDVNQSPFNVGLPIELSEFNLDQVQTLIERHRLQWSTSQVETLMAIAGGHPYLIRLALYHLAQNQLTLSELIQSAPTEAGIYGDHLRRHLWNLRQHSELAAAYQTVVMSDRPVELESILAFKLHSLGLVQLSGNEVTPRFELYRAYFRERL